MSTIILSAYLSALCKFSIWYSGKNMQVDYMFWRSIFSGLLNPISKRGFLYYLHLNFIELLCFL